MEHDPEPKNDSESLFLKQAIDKIADLNKIFNTTIEDLLNKLKSTTVSNDIENDSLLTENDNENRIFEKIYSRLNVTCDLGIDTIHEVKSNLTVGYKQWKSSVDSGITTTTENGDKTHVENDDKAELKLRLVPIEKLMMPTFTKNNKQSSSTQRSSGIEKNVAVAGSRRQQDNKRSAAVEKQRPVRACTKSIPTICLDDSTSNSDSSDDKPISSRIDKAKKNISAKAGSIDTVNNAMAKKLDSHISARKEVPLEKMIKPFQVRLERLPLNKLDEILKKYRLTLISNHLKEAISEASERGTSNKQSTDVSKVKETSNTKQVKLSTADDVDAEKDTNQNELEKNDAAKKKLLANLNNSSSSDSSEEEPTEGTVKSAGAKSNDEHKPSSENDSGKEAETENDDAAATNPSENKNVKVKCNSEASSPVAEKQSVNNTMNGDKEKPKAKSRASRRTRNSTSTVSTENKNADSDDDLIVSKLTKISKHSSNAISKSSKNRSASQTKAKKETEVSLLSIAENIESIAEDGENVDPSEVETPDEKNDEETAIQKLNEEVKKKLLDTSSDDEDFDNELSKDCETNETNSNKDKTTDTAKGTKRKVSSDEDNENAKKKGADDSNNSDSDKALADKHDESEKKLSSKQKDNDSDKSEKSSHSKTRQLSKEKKKIVSSSDEDEIFERRKMSSRKSKPSKKDIGSDESTNVEDSSGEDIQKASTSKKATEKRRRSSTSNYSDSSGAFQPKKLKKKVENKASSSDESEEENSSNDDSKKPKKRRIRRQKNSDSSNSDGDDKSPNKGRKNIRKVLKVKDLEVDTKKAAKIEVERKKRIEERQKTYNQVYDENIEKIQVIEKLVLDFEDETKEELLSVDKGLVKKLKPHQANGIKFMWDACFESLAQMENNVGSGCILAHCMGLGKSLQIVALTHTLLTHSDATGVERVLVIAPLSTVLNWVNEYKIWLKHCKKNKNIEVFEISKFKKNIERAYKLQEWYESGGVLVMGYDMFRNLVSETGGRQRKKIKEQIQKCLIDPGPDMVVCDEGHLLKNEKTSLSKAVNRLKTLRRIVLTGTPLQNNLKEYYCMVQFVKPNLLGKYTEYMNRFVNPITNGQYTDSTPYDIQIMKRRSHVLHKMLDGCVQRRDYGVLAPFLPPKHEYVVYIQLTELQCKLYKFYMDSKSGRLDPGMKKSSALFSDFQNLQRIWTHPRVLRYNSDRYEIVQQKKRDLETTDDEEGSLNNFIDDDDESGSSTPQDSNSSNSGSEASVHSDAKKPKKTQGTRRTRGNQQANDKEDSPGPEPIKIDNPTEWWTSMVDEITDLDNIEISGKLFFLFSLLEECEKIGDKLLVFSQSLYSLDVIEHFLALIDARTRENNKNDEDDKEGDKDNNARGNFSGNWSLGGDYFRLDGSTSIENRNAACKYFNNAENTRARLFLISTRAGGLGINLVAANRVVIFDVSWNPSHDTQSIFRVYRFGQIKPCYIYRFIALGTMEEKIYERQVTKLAISKRVIDEQQIDRHYKEHDLMELYNYDIEPEETRPVPLLPKDRLFAEMLKKHETIIYKFHEHDTLLENKEEETLNEEERKAAWEEFEAEKSRPVINYTARPMGMGPVTSNMIFGFRSDILLRLLNIKARKDNPLFTEYELKQLVPLLLQQLYHQMEAGDTSLYQSLINLQSELEIQTPVPYPVLNQYGFPSNMVNNIASLAGGNVLNPFATNAQIVNLYRSHQQQLTNQMGALRGPPQIQAGEPITIPSDGE